MKNIGPLAGHSSVTDTGRREQGSVLIFLIVLMVIFTALGIGMVSMFGSSVLSVFSSNSYRRAHYLAESGLRYAISSSRNASGLDRETALTAIDDGSVAGKWFNVFPGLSRYQVRVHPYWSKTASGTGAPTTVITATAPNSGLPPDFAIPGVGSGARLQVGTSSPVGINSVSGAAPGAKTLSYNLATAVTIPVGSNAYANLAFPTRNANQQITKGSLTTLLLDIGDLGAIPRKNGRFAAYDPDAGPPPSIDKKELASNHPSFAYQTARLTSGMVQLENITWEPPQNNPPTYNENTATFPANSYLAFTQTAQLVATGDQLQTQKELTDSLPIFSSTSTLEPPGNFAPPALTPDGSGFNTLEALDLTRSGDRVVKASYTATGGVHTAWARIQKLGQTGYSFADPEETRRDIGYHVAPIADAISDNLRNTWIQYHKLSYDVQIKVGWDYHLDYAAQGITFRWHESPVFPGKYQGYGISFLRFDCQNQSCSDMIPNYVKPGSGASLKDDLLLVLWEQKVDAYGVETKDWLAYARLGKPANYGSHHSLVRPPAERSPADPDQKATGNQGVTIDGRVNDNATLVVRVEDKYLGSQRVNEIKLFYGDASTYSNWSNDSRTPDSVATNKERARYYPQWLETGNGGTLAAINPRWPTNRFGLNGTSSAYWHDSMTSYDYFTLGSSAPTAPFNTVTMIPNPSPRTGFTSPVILLADHCTIRTTDFVLDAFPSGRKEIGLAAMGNLRTIIIERPDGTTYNYPVTVAFDDFYIQILGGY